ncbi:MAG: hypothetical protein KKF65_04075 [Nanoarchaeota archaeon]|nr:hypothetical protein [Nanoarchaeota archaeon]
MQVETRKQLGNIIATSIYYRDTNKTMNHYEYSYVAIIHNFCLGHIDVYEAAESLHKEMMHETNKYLNIKRNIRNLKWKKIGLDTAAITSGIASIIIFGYFIGPFLSVELVQCVNKKTDSIDKKIKTIKSNNSIVCYKEKLICCEKSIDIITSQLEIIKPQLNKLLQYN